MSAGAIITELSNIPDIYNWEGLLEECEDTLASGTGLAATDPGLLSIIKSEPDRGTLNSDKLLLTVPDK